MVGKLTFSAYLIHIVVVYILVMSSQSTFILTRDATVYTFFGIYVLSYFAAYLLSMSVEVPLLNIEKTILFPPKAKPNHAEAKEDVGLKINSNRDTQYCDSEGITTNGEPTNGEDSLF